MFDRDRDPGELPSEHLEHEITALAAHIYAATCRWLLLIAEFDRRECHRTWGLQSTTAWLAWTCGLTPRAAREHVRVAKALVDLPRIRESFARGELSYSKVRALTRAALPETEEELLELAHRATAAQLERAVRAFRSAVAVAEGQPPADTFFAWAWEDDGTLSVRGRLPADEGALLIEAMHNGHRIVAGRHLGNAVEGQQPPAQRHTDALAAVAEASLSATASSSGGDRYQVIVHVDARGRRELDEGSALSLETTRRVLCDAALVPLAEDENGPMAAGRRTRTIPAGLRRALRARDGGCAFPGCTNSRFTDAHHIDHWADGGDTSLDNLVQLCRRHHTLIHEGGFAVGRDDRGGLEFRRPGGGVLQPLPDKLRSHPEAFRGLTDPGTAPRPASGDPLDLDLTVGCMLERRERALAGAR